MTRLRRTNARARAMKDARTGFEVGNAQGVLDGDLDGFIRAYLLQTAGDV